MITVKKIEPQLVEHFDNNKNSLGFLNYEEHLDLRVQIKEQEVKGYFLKFKNECIRIDHKGTLEKYPDGMYETVTDYLMRLI